MFQNIFGFLFAWYNLPYTVFLGLGFVLAGLQLFGLSQDHDSDVDADLDLDVDADADLDLDHDADIEASADHDADAGELSGFSWLAFIGFGKTPVMVVLLVLFFSIGLLGWLFNGMVTSIFGFFSGLALLVTGLASLVVGVFITSRVTRTIGRMLPPVSSTATKAEAMVGMQAQVISPFVDRKYGMVHFRDAGGTLISLFAISEDEKPIVRGETVILLSYDAAARRYLVTRR
jgi:membrane protein implicated in regulation of membrane protease activity